MQAPTPSHPDTVNPIQEGDSNVYAYVQVPDLLNAAADTILRQALRAGLRERAIQLVVS